MYKTLRQEAKAVMTYLPIHEPSSSSVGSVLLTTCSWGRSTAEYPIGMPAPAASRNAAPDTSNCKHTSHFNTKLFPYVGTELRI